jgi:hypothetical protein
VSRADAELRRLASESSGLGAPRESEPLPLAGALPSEPGDSLTMDSSSGSGERSPEHGSTLSTPNANDADSALGEQQTTTTKQGEPVRAIARHFASPFEADQAEEPSP